MNVFQSGFDERLRDWKNLRLIIRGESLDKACVHVDDWWQRVPLVNHHIHWADQNSWPDPWTLLSENTYCTLTRAIGICYTLLMSDITDVELAQASDPYGDEYDIVLVGHAKYVLNYHPGTVLSNNFTDFKIIRKLDISHLQKQI
jgi:hypothetical protein